MNYREIKSTPPHLIDCNMNTRDTYVKIVVVVKHLFHSYRIDMRDMKIYDEQSAWKRQI